MNNGASEDINDIVGIQLIPCNVELTAAFVSENNPYNVKFDPCLKKAINGADGFVPTDGPLFSISQEVSGFESENDELILGMMHHLIIRSIKILAEYLTSNQAIHQM